MEVQPIPDHPALIAFKQLSEAKEWSNIPSLTATPEAALMWKRFLDFLVLIEDLFESTPVSQTSVHGLNLLKSVFDQILMQLSAFRAQGQIVNLSQAITHIDQQAFPNLWAFAPIRNAKSFARKSTEEVSTYSQKVILEFQTANAALESKADALTKELTELRKQIAVTQKQIDSEQVRVSAVADEGRANFATAASSMKVDFDTQLIASKGGFTSLLDASTQSVEELKADTLTKANALVQKMESKHAEAKKLIGLIGDTAVTGNYQISAKNESEQADTWRRITLGVFVIAACAGGWALFELASKTIAWELALVRMLFGALVASVAFYTANESARHRTNSDRAKRVELELAALGPFLEEMPKEKREEIRQKLAEKYFANEIPAHEVGGVITAKDALAFFDKSVDAVQKLSKK
jgi:hypothetical protein